MDVYICTCTNLNVILKHKDISFTQKEVKNDNPLGHDCAWLIINLAVRWLFSLFHHTICPVKSNFVRTTSQNGQLLDVISSTELWKHSSLLYLLSHKLVQCGFSRQNLVQMTHNSQLITIQTNNNIVVMWFDITCIIIQPVIPWDDVTIC